MLFGGTIFGARRGKQILRGRTRSFSGVQKSSHLDDVGPIQLASEPQQRLDHLRKRIDPEVLARRETLEEAESLVAATEPVENRPSSNTDVAC